MTFRKTIVKYVEISAKMVVIFKLDGLLSFNDMSSCHLHSYLVNM